MPIDEKYPLALPAGTILAGQYTIEKVLGQGGFGITYKARDYKTGREVAVKEFFPDTLAYREMTTVISYPGERAESYEYGKEGFLQEAKTLAEFIGNENIVRIHSYFEENGTAYFVMDYIDGKSFDEYIKEKGGKISVEEAKSILIPIMDALGAVHSKGIVHRDVTPDNIYITADGTVKLLDFGAARYSLGDKSRSLDVILKHGFAPKEQYTRRGKQGPFTDIYSLAATFYFAITGRRPPDSVDRLDEDELIPPSNLGVSITDYQETAILQALSVQPAERFESMAVFKNVLLNEAPPVKQIFFTAPQPVTDLPPAAPASTESPVTERAAAPSAAALKADLAAVLHSLPDIVRKKKKVIAMAAAAVGVIAAAFFAGRAFSGATPPADSEDPDAVYVAELESAADTTVKWFVNETQPAATTEATTAKVTTEVTTKMTTAAASATTAKTTAKPATQTTASKAGKVLGNRAQNLKNSGIRMTEGNYTFCVDDNRRVLYYLDKDGQRHDLYNVKTGAFSSLSYVDGVLYFVYNNCAYSRNIMTNEQDQMIPELEFAQNSVHTLYVMADYYFVYCESGAERVLYRVSRKNGTMEEKVMVDSGSHFTFYGDWLYLIVTSTDNRSVILRTKADDFNQWSEDFVVANNTAANFSSPVIDSGYIYVLLQDEDSTSIVRFNADLTSPQTDQTVWDVSSMANGKTACNLSVYKQNMFFCTKEDNGDTQTLYHITAISDGSYDSDKSGMVRDDILDGISITWLYGKCWIYYLRWDAESQNYILKSKAYDPDGNDVTNS